MKGAGLAAALAVVGAAVGLAVALAWPARYVATTTVIVRADGVPAALPTVAALATSDAVVHNVATALHLPEGRVRDHLRASAVGRSALVRVRYRDTDELRAARVAQQAASVLQAVAAPRLGSRVQVEVVDPARATRASRPWAADLVLGALAGAAAGFVLPVVRRRAPAAPPAHGRADEHDLLARVRAALADREAEFAEEQLLEWYALLGVLSAETVDGRLAPPLERVARERFAPLLEP